jgi:hypothetical protein
MVFMVPAPTPANTITEHSIQVIGKPLPKAGGGSMEASSMDRREVREVAHLRLRMLEELDEIDSPQVHSHRNPLWARDRSSRLR